VAADGTVNMLSSTKRGTSNSGGGGEIRTQACQACHQAKTKCRGGGTSGDNDPCERCTKFQLTCLPHVSRQGQGKRRKRQPEESSDGGLAASSEDACVLRQLVRVTAQRHGQHWGLRYLIHSWIAFAVRRRSFGLLERASRLAEQLELSMDDILVVSSRMDFLPGILLTTAPQQCLGPAQELRWQDIPERLLQATATTSDTSRESRWIWIREMDSGMSRYLVSDAFARDIAPLSLITETWQRNQQPVVELFLGEAGSSKSKHTQAFAHQIQSWDRADKTPECTRLGPVELTTQTRRGTLPVDQIACLDIVDLSRSYYFLEYVPSSSSSPQGDCPENLSNDDTESNLGDLSVVDFALDDPEFQLFLDLIGDDTMDPSINRG